MYLLNIFNITYMVLGAVRCGFLETKSAPLPAGAYFAPPLWPAVQ